MLEVAAWRKKEGGGRGRLESEGRKEFGRAMRLKVGHLARRLRSSLP